MEWKSRAHPISDVRDWSRADRLELQPDFQRNVVWTRAAQIALIDTILRDIPIPKIYIKSVIKNETTYRVVIDGQQRLTAILAFVENRLKLKLPHISLPEYDGKFFDTLPVEIKNKVLSYNIDFNEIFNPTEEELRDLYARVNKYTVQLNKQELRRADFPGEFLDLSEELADIEFFTDCKLFSSGQKRRMLDIEYVEELLCVLLEGEQDKKDSLDDFCERYSIFPTGKENVKSEFLDVLNDLADIFNNEISLVNSRFRQHADFYSLFGSVLNFKRESRKIIDSELCRVRRSLLTLDKEITPHSANEAYSEYAIRCISDSNSKSTRIWRKQFLSDYLKLLYVPSDELEEE